MAVGLELKLHIYFTNPLAFLQSEFGFKGFLLKSTDSTDSIF